MARRVRPRGQHGARALHAPLLGRAQGRPRGRPGGRVARRAGRRRGHDDGCDGGPARGGPHDLRPRPPRAGPPRPRPRGAQEGGPPLRADPRRRATALRTVGVQRHDGRAARPGRQQQHAVRAARAAPGGEGGVPGPEVGLAAVHAPLRVDGRRGRGLGLRLPGHDGGVLRVDDGGGRREPRPLQGDAARGALGVEIPLPRGPGDRVGAAVACEPLRGRPQPADRGGGDGGAPRPAAGAARRAGAYREGAEWLVARQGPDGGWANPDASMGAPEPPLVATCFALLFLRRATPPVVTVPEGDAR